MAIFNFTALSANGDQQEGSREATNKDELKQSLAVEGMQMLSAEEEASNGISFLTPSVKKKDLVYLTGQLAIMIETGINLAAALESVVEQVESVRLKVALRDVKGRVESGEDFSATLEDYPNIFDPKMVALVRSSEQTGSLGEMLQRISSLLAREMSQAAKVKSAMTYPSIMVVVAVGVTIFLLTYILPQFAPLFRRKSIELPQLTIILMAVSKNLLAYWWAWIICGVGGATGMVFWLKSANGKRIMDGVRIHAPIIGPAVRMIILSRSVRTLGLMVKSGVPMLEALKMTSEVAGNLHYEKVWLHVVERVTQGERIVDSLRGNPLFPKSLVQMIGSGEDTGRLDFVLEKIGDHYDEEVDTALKTVTQMIEPILIVVMGVVVGGISMALLLPIFRISRAT
jgi:type IV pilus assembly protein PilC